MEAMMDDIDKKIITLLQQNGRETNARLAKESGISPSAMIERVKRLEKDGVIKGYTALVEPEALGKGTSALISVTLAVHQFSSIHNFKEEIDRLEEVLECYHIAGEYDFVLKVLVEDMKTYEDFIINKLTRIQGIDKIHTSFILSAFKQTTVIK